MRHLIAAGFQARDLLHPLRFWGYQFWSGIGSDLGELTLLGAVVALAKHHNCGEKGCWRLGHLHPQHGRPVCAKHYHSQPRLGAC